MATTRAFAYNPSQNPIPGTDSYGTLVIGTSNLDFSKDYGGIKWWMGPDETLGYVIGGVVSGGTQPSPVGDIGTVEFWRTDNLTTEEFLLLANQISGQYFTNASDAITWLNNNGYWTSYDPLFITPTPTSSMMPVSPTMTPAVTTTPTVTPSLTPGLPEFMAFAYSLRKIDSSYSGAAVRVRRSSDNSEQDIGFLNGVLDTTALTSFVGSGNGFVTTWYDQSGKNRNATQTNASSQPRIVNSGTIQTLSGKPTINWLNNSALNWRSTLPQEIKLVNNLVFVAKSDASPNNLASLFNGTGYENQDLGLIRIDFSNTYYQAPSTLGSTPSHLTYDLGSFYFNGNLVTTSNSVLTQHIGFVNVGTSYKTTIGGVSIGSAWYGRTWKGPISEFILYGGDQSSNRSNIESEINNFYQIY